MDITLLKPHPKNEKIYGQENIKELADKIAESNWINPLIVTKDNVIISGHRRYTACLSLDIKEVPVEFVELENENEILERLLLENFSREKTLYQKTREAMVWEEIEKEKANKRQLKGTTLGSNEPKGRVTDIVSNKADISSGTTYKRSRTVVKEIDKLLEQGRKKDTEFLITVLNENANGALEIVKAGKINEIIEEVKDKVINKEIPVKEILKEIKESNIKKDETSTINKQVVKEINMGIEKEKEEKPIIMEDLPQNNKKAIEANEESKQLQDKIIENLANQTSMLSNNIVTDFQIDKDNFIKEMSKYIELEDSFEEMKQEEKTKITDAIDEMKAMIDKIMNFLY